MQARKPPLHRSLCGLEGCGLTVCLRRPGLLDGDEGGLRRGLQGEVRRHTLDYHTTHTYVSMRVLDPETRRAVECYRLSLLTGAVFAQVRCEGPA